MNTYNYRINLFNNNYIIITTTTIISKHHKYLNNNTDQNAIIWHNLYNSLKKANIPSISPIAIAKNTIEGQIVMNELTEEAKAITIEHIKNACVIAAYESNPFVNHLSYIILTNPQTNNFGNDKEFAKQYGQNVTNFILHNNSLKEYNNQMNGQLPYEYDRYVFLYQDGTIEETQLPAIKEAKTKIKTK